MYESVLPEILSSPVPSPAGPGDDRIDLLGPRRGPTPAARVVLDRLSRAGSLPIVRSFPRGAIVVFDHDLRYLSAGGLSLAGMGLSEETLQGRTIFEIFPAEVAAAMAPSYRAALAGTESAVHVPFGGRTYLQRVGPLRDADGAIVAGMGFTQDVTDSRRLEQSHRESEERLRQVIEHAPMGLAILRPNLGVIQVNPAFCRLTGYGEQQLLDLNAADLLVDPHGDLDKARISRLFRGAAPAYTADVRFRSADGTVAWAALSVSLLRSADGSPAQFIVQVKDIGERKRAEVALLDRSRRLRDAESVGHSGSWELDVLTDQLSWSDGLFAVYGMDQQSFGGRHDAGEQFIHPEDRPRVRAAMDACLGHGVPLELRYRLTRPNDGALRWCEARAERLYEDGRLVRIGGSVVDITELHESEERLRQVIEHAPMGLAIIDRQQSYLQVNPAFCAITGYSEEQLLQMTVVDIPDPIDPAADRAGMHRVLRGEEVSYTSDTRFRAADGSIRWVARSASRLTTADGSPQLIVQIKDIGDRKRAEQALMDKTRRLREAETVGRMGSWQLDLATGLLSFSDGLLALYGISPADFRGDRDVTLEMTHPDDRAKLRAATNACIGQGVPFELRCRSIRPGDGQLRWYEIRAERFQSGGRPDRVGGNVVDVTDLALAEAEVRTAYTFQQTVMDASPDLIFAYRIASRSVVWSNRSLSGVLGFPVPGAGADAQSLMDGFVPQAAARELEAALHSALDDVSDDTRHINLRLQDAAGRYRWFLLRATPLHRDDLGGVTELVGVLRDVTDAIVAERLLKHSALHDSLTGLPNRALLIDRIDGALARSGRDHREISVLFCDLDGFKHINDTAGHKAGDAVLIETALRLQALLREGDTVARVGGDEFIILVEPWDRRAAEEHAVGRDEDETAARDRALAPHVAERIAHALRDPVVVNGVEHVVTASIGITYGTQSLLGDLRSVTADEMLQDADAAMYKAKSRGRNRFEVFEHSMRASLQERGRIEYLLRQVLATTTHPTTADGGAQPSGRLSAAYQPIFDSVTGELTGFEALARLVDADGTSVPPDVFIPLAEECGLIRPLGVFILDRACRQLAAWRSTPHMAGITIAVNVSALQAAEGTLGEDVQRALTAHGLEPSDIMLELTETALLQAAHSTIVNLRALHAKGIGIAIDDFGVGYASLRYLATLPISFLKIDKSFTAGLPHDVISSKIVMAVAGLAADLGLGCIVEGVETEQQRDALPPGVQLQGYLTGRPQPGEEIDLARLIAHGSLPI